MRAPAVITLFAISMPYVARGQQSNLPARGVPTSQFGTYVQPHRLVVFPFFAYTRDQNMEYQPAEFGYGLSQDLRGRYRSTQAQLFLAYGLTDWLAVEVEGSRMHVTFEKSSADTTAMPARIVESGIADLEGQVRVRLARERGHRPEIFASLELLPPQHKDKVLIGDAQWDVKGGIGVVRGYRWGTMTFRTTIEYNRGDTHWDLGETSLEFWRNVGSAGRLFLAIEGGEGGAPDEYTFVSGLRWRLGRNVFVKLDNAFGLMSKATDWEPQAGILWEGP